MDGAAPDVRNPKSREHERQRGNMMAYTCTVKNIIH